MGLSLAVVAAAGRGTRFLPTTKTVPKELLPLLDRPVIHHLVEEIAAAGIHKIAIVTRPSTGKALRRYFSPDVDWDAYLAGQGKAHLLQPLYELIGQVSLSFVTQSPDLPYGTGAPLLAARERLAGPFLYLYGDDVILERPLGQTIRALAALYEGEGADAVVAAVRVPREALAQVGSIAYRPGTAQVERIVEKPDPAHAPSDVTPIGRMVLSPGILAVLEEQRRRLRPGHELWMTDALTALAQAGQVLAPLIPGRWLTTGDPHNLLRATLALLDLPDLSGSSELPERWRRLT